MVIAPSLRAGDPGLNPGPGENFSLKLSIQVVRLRHMKGDADDDNNNNNNNVFNLNKVSFEKWILLSFTL